MEFVRGFTPHVVLTELPEVEFFSNYHHHDSVRESWSMLTRSTFVGTAAWLAAAVLFRRYAIRRLERPATAPPKHMR